MRSMTSVAERRASMQRFVNDPERVVEDARRLRSPASDGVASTPNPRVLLASRGPEGGSAS